MYILLPWVTSTLRSVIYLGLTATSNQKFEDTHGRQNIEENYFLVYHYMHAKISTQNIF